MILTKIGNRPSQLWKIIKFFIKNSQLIWRNFKKRNTLILCMILKIMFRKFKECQLFESPNIRMTTRAVAYRGRDLGVSITQSWQRERGVSMKRTLFRKVWSQVEPWQNRFTLISYNLVRWNFFGINSQLWNGRLTLERVLVWLLLEVRYISSGVLVLTCTEMFKY